MITLDFWDVFSVGQSLYVLGTDLLSYQTKVIQVESINLDNSTFICVEGSTYKFGGIQGLNIRNMNFLDNWLKSKSININDVKRVNIYA